MKGLRTRKWLSNANGLLVRCESVLLRNQFLLIVEYFFHLNVFVIHILIKNSIKEFNKNRYELYHKQYIFLEVL